MDYDITWVEVFAERPLGGNLLPVITGADGVDDGVLAAVARRFQQSETSFVQRPTDEHVDYRHRIFLVTGEIPFAGHPSLGTAAVIAHRAGARRCATCSRRSPAISRSRSSSTAASDGCR
jgi:PhzF family phenazine biosynthesis protein